MFERIGDVAALRQQFVGYDEAPPAKRAPGKPDKGDVAKKARAKPPANVAKRKRRNQP